MPILEGTSSSRGHWQKKLRLVKGLERCPLPTKIVFSGNQLEAGLTLPASSLQANMQDDSAAFDAWALALLTYCGVDKVKLEADDTHEFDAPHFQRFLYRAHRFAELFPVHGNFTRYAAKALDVSIKRILNQPEKRPADTQDTTSNLAWSRVKEVGFDSSETALENSLLISKQFRDVFSLGKLMRQWPVGLFANEVRRGKNNSNMIFTGGKSAIDLIGISGDTLLLFELKKKNNRKAGGISELLFYTNVMRDALRGDFVFGPDSYGTHTISSRDITSCERIRSILIAPDFHPLVWNDKIEPEERMLSKLNSAVKQKWEIPVSFEIVHISAVPSSTEPDFQFRIGS